MTGGRSLCEVLLLIFLMPMVKHVAGYDLASTGRIRLRHANQRKCPAECLACNKRGVCTQCVPGRYGDWCQQYCNINCETCSADGVCITCTNTSKGYGPFCNQQCDLCKNETCDRNRCTDGCQDKFFETPYQLLPGLPTNYECEECPEFCKTCQSRSNCTGCIGSLWGTTCENQCPSNCDTKSCHQISGKCINSACDLGQYHGLEGRCTSCPSFCLSCISAENCTACVRERHGNTCESINCTGVSSCTDEEVTTGTTYAIISPKSDRSVSNTSSNAISILAFRHRNVMFIVCVLISIMYC